MTKINLMQCVGKHHEIGSRVPYYATVSDKTDAANAAVYVFLEMPAEDYIPVFNGFVNDGIMPGGLLVFVRPGILPATLPGGSDRGMRAEEFDQYGHEFIDFIIEDLLPEAAAANAVTMSANPDMHFYMGGSSCGMSTWNALWFRNDFFRRGFMSSPTFNALRGGEEPMVLVRKCETRPMRFYLTVGTTEPDYFFGDLYNAAVNAKGAFDHCGYDFKFEMFMRGKHCAGLGKTEVLQRVMTFVWHDWQTQPVTAGGNPLRIQNVLADGSRWEPADSLPPRRPAVAPDGGSYRADGSRILLCRNGEETAVADGLSRVSALAVSSDYWRLYVADSDHRFVYAYAIQADGTLGAQYKLAPFHLAHDCRRIGATDMCVAADDRVLVATELGVQGIVSFGINDIILPLPGDLPADSVRLEGNILYAASGDKIFKRTLKISAPPADGTPQAPATPEYHDNFGYSRPHSMPDRP